MEDPIGAVLLIGGILLGAVVLMMGWAWCVQKLWNQAVKKFWAARPKDEDNKDPGRETTQAQDKTPWLWGEDSADSLDHACVMVETFLINEVENGPGWIVVHGPDHYDIDIRVRLAKQ